MKQNTIKPGDVFQLNGGGSCIVIEFNGCYDVIIEHQDEYKHRAKVAASQLRDGRIRNPFRPSMYGIGFVGHGKHGASKNGKDTRPYTTWVRMLERCYCPKKQSTNKSYIGCTVDPVWHNFQNFADWCESQPFKGPGYQLDKDILKPGNKLYGPDWCRLVPEKVNKTININSERRSGLPPGVEQKGKRFYAKIGKSGAIEYLGNFHSAESAFNAYKKAREEYVRSTADEYRPYMPDEIYRALKSYTVNITD